MNTSSKVNKLKKVVNTTGRVSAKKAASYLHSMQNSSTTKINPAKQVTAPNWNPKHFRLFVGNLGPDGNNELLKEAFLKYPSMSQVHVPIDRKTSKNKGFGFVAFGKSEDYLHAFQEMNGKYIGQHPVQLKRAESSVPKKTKNKRK